MSEFQDFEQFTVEQDGDSQLVRDLRAQIKRLGGEVKKLSAENAEFRGQVRSTRLEDILKANNVSTKVAKLIPADLEVTDESVKAWLDEFADVFNISRDDTPTGERDTAGGGDDTAPGGSTVPEDEQRAYQRAQLVEAQGGRVEHIGEDKIRQVLAEAEKAGSADAGFQILREHGLAL